VALAARRAEEEFREYEDRVKKIAQ